jgi:hypothetical protein
VSVKIRHFLTFASILAITVFGFSQTPRTVRWQESDPNSKRLVREGVVVKQLQIDGMDGITVTASMRDRPDSFLVELEIRNNGRRDLKIQPEKFRLQAIRLRSKNLPYIPADYLARRVIVSANSQANDIEWRGSLATKTSTRTVVEHVPTSVLIDPTGIVLHKGEHIAVVQRTVTETVPDEHERTRSKLEAERMRSEAKLETNRILVTALTEGSLSSQTIVSGKSYFDRDRDIQEILLLLPLGDLTVEIPFKTVRKGKFHKGIPKIIGSQIEFE